MTAVAERPSEGRGDIPGVNFKGTPKLSQTAADEQRRAALKVANAKRSLHAQLKRDLAGLSVMESRNLAGHVLVYDRERFGSIELGHLLKAIRGWGAERSRRLCQKLGLNERSRLSGLSEPEVEAIAAFLAGKAGANG